MIGSKSGELEACLFRVESLSDKKQRFKVNVNAQEYHLVGRVGDGEEFHVVFDRTIGAVRDGVCGGDEEGDATLHQADDASNQLE